MPANAWQKDPARVQPFLKEGLALVDRAMEAILTEYGSGPTDKPHEDLESRQNTTFGLDMVMDLSSFQVGGSSGSGGEKPRLPRNGGWATPQSFRGLVRRVLHAIMTQDTFTLVVTGDAAAAGHGNLFKQSYTMQFHKVMEPVFALLGVTLKTRNLAQPAGIMPSGMGAKDIFGKEVDVIIWDGSPTENDNAGVQDLVFRQALLSGNRVPFVLGGPLGRLQLLHEQVGADVGQYGQALEGLPVCTSQKQSKTVPYAARCRICEGPKKADWCGSKFQANCWIPRNDVTPTRKQRPHPDGQVEANPGWKWHQAVGRSIAFMILRAIKEGLTQWQAAENYALPDNAWHVHQHYQAVRENMLKLKDTPCFHFAAAGGLPEAFCTKPMNARTEFAPRANPERSGIHSIMRPAPNGHVPQPLEKALYTGPDVFNKYTAIPDGEINVLDIVSNGRVLEEEERRRRLDAPIVPGMGTYLNDGVDGYCDGGWNSECKRTAKSSCLLSGHNDVRSGILLDGFSGWMVMTLTQMKEGIVVVMLETWHYAFENQLTSGWRKVNNGEIEKRVLLQEPNKPHHLPKDGSHRRLSLPPRAPEYCPEFKFEFAIDGKVTTWDRDEFQARLKRLQEVQTLMNNQSFTKDARDVEFAVRITGCRDSTRKSISLTHIYWA